MCDKTIVIEAFCLDKTYVYLRDKTKPVNYTL